MMIALKSAHIHMDAGLAKLFGTCDNAYVAYHRETGRLLVSPDTSQWFRKMYGPSRFLLKESNTKGDKSLGIREILIDNDLDMTDRPLDYEILTKTSLIKICI